MSEKIINKVNNIVTTAYNRGWDDSTKDANGEEDFLSLDNCATHANEIDALYQSQITKLESEKAELVVEKGELWAIIRDVQSNAAIGKPKWHIIEAKIENLAALTQEGGD